jgi:hypothetical protein
MPPGTPLPLLAAAYGKTIGPLLGILWVLGEYGLRWLKSKVT